MSSTYNHLRKRRVENERGMEILIREEVEHRPVSIGGSGGQGPAEMPGAG
jgi:hypothetical protein